MSKGHNIVDTEICHNIVDGGRDPKKRGLHKKSSVHSCQPSAKGGLMLRVASDATRTALDVGSPAAIIDMNGWLSAAFKYPLFACVHDVVNTSPSDLDQISLPTNTGARTG